MPIQASENPEAFRSFEHEGWQTVSAGYQEHFGRLTGQTVPATLEAAGIAGGMRVLDVCTGPGILAAAILAQGAAPVGLDFSSEALEIARRGVPEAEFHQGDAQELPFADETFDAAVCGYGLLHVPEPEKALSEMRRVLRPGARMAVSVWEGPKPSNGFGLIFGALKAHGDLNVPLPHGPDMFQFSERETMSGALEGVGLRDATVRTFDQSWDFDGPLDILGALLKGTVRGRALLLGQTPDVRKAIDSAVAKGIDKFRATDGKFRVPMPAVIGAGVK